jgi:transcription antitermination factor NusG
MEDFIQISRVMADDILYLQDISTKLSLGQKVRVTEGPFSGVEGTVVRIKRSRRVVVELPGMLAVATTYVQPQHLELI